MLFDNHGISLLCLQLASSLAHIRTVVLASFFVRKRRIRKKNSFQIHKTFAIYLLCVLLFPVSGPETAQNEEDESEMNV